MDVKNEDGKKERLFLYYDGESVSGKVGVFPLLQLTCTYLWWFSFFVYNSIEADGSTSHHSLIFIAISYLESIKHVMIQLVRDWTGNKFGPMAVRYA